MLIRLHIIFIMLDIYKRLIEVLIHSILVSLCHNETSRLLQSYYLLYKRPDVFTIRGMNVYISPF